MSYIVHQHTIPTPYLVGPVHIYEVEFEGEVLLFDTGPPTSEGLQYLIDHIDLQKLSAVFVTHFHPDHYGLLSEIEKRSDALLIVPKKDVILLEDSNERNQFICTYLEENGFPDKIIHEMKSTILSFHKNIHFAKNYSYLERSNKLLSKYGIKSFSCPGHSQTDIVFVFGQYAVTGDLLLKDIFQVPLLDLDADVAHTRFFNYYHYCRSIYKIKQLESFQILSSHNEPIKNVSQQIAFYANKIIHRSDRLKPLVENGKNIFEITTQLFPEIQDNTFRLYLKASEIVFLKDYLEKPELLQNALRDNAIQL